MTKKIIINALRSRFLKLVRNNKKLEQTIYVSNRLFNRLELKGFMAELVMYIDYEYFNQTGKLHLKRK